jgi:thiamine phosphate synthase YjbQ (UPF0047 family)
MAFHYQALTIETPACKEFFDLTLKFQNFVSGTKIKNGLALVYTAHTSCCVIIQEESEDVTHYGTQLILQDTLNVLAKIAPAVSHEGDYLHPGPIHIKNAAELRQELPEWGLNTDGHIMSSILGRSETVPLVDGSLILGEFGRVYFGDLDSVRPRKRTVHFIVQGD